MATLFLAIILVYVLLFQVRGSSMQTSSNTSWWAIHISMTSGDSTFATVDQQRNAFTLTTGTTQHTWLQTTWSIATWANLATQVSSLTTTGNQNWNTTTNTGGITILSGTNVFYWSIEAVEKLGIKYQYALVDDKNIYYINLGNPTYDFASIARKLWGNLYELKTEQELSQNKLFGTKVIYINLPEYKEKRVLMLLYIKDQVRLIQMDYALYHKTKAYLKSLFTQ